MLIEANDQDHRRHHQHAAADAEQARQQPSGQADRQECEDLQRGHVTSIVTAIAIISIAKPMRSRSSPTRAMSLAPI